jgi:hypothetical protein
MTQENVTGDYPAPLLTVPAAGRRLRLSSYRIYGLLARGELEATTAENGRGGVDTLVTTASVTRFAARREARSQGARAA